MPRSDEAQRLIEEHIATLGERKAQLEPALAHLNASARNEGRNRRGQEAGGGGGPRAPDGDSAGGVAPATFR